MATGVETWGKVGDLIKEKFSGDLGIIVCEPYLLRSFHTMQDVWCVNVLWQGSDHPSKMDVTAFKNGAVSLVNEDG
tara:strand:+ start:901 stop:1128 length:228 start_codon:yes stop_codon:yes gene_type:complete